VLGYINQFCITIKYLRQDTYGKKKFIEFTALEGHNSRSVGLTGLASGEGREW
jgi:hypothetical protein